MPRKPLVRRARAPRACTVTLSAAAAAAAAATASAIARRLHTCAPAAVVAAAAAQPTSAPTTAVVSPNTTPPTRGPPRARRRSGDGLGAVVNARSRRVGRSRPRHGWRCEAVGAGGGAADGRRRRRDGQRRTSCWRPRRCRWQKKKQRAGGGRGRRPDGGDVELEPPRAGFHRRGVFGKGCSSLAGRGSAERGGSGGGWVVGSPGGAAPLSAQQHTCHAPWAEPASWSYWGPRPQRWCGHALSAERALMHGPSMRVAILHDGGRLFSTGRLLRSGRALPVLCRRTPVVRTSRRPGWATTGVQHRDFSRRAHAQHSRFVPVSVAKSEQKTYRG